MIVCSFSIVVVVAVLGLILFFIAPNLSLHDCTNSVNLFSLLFISLLLLLLLLSLLLLLLVEFGWFSDVQLCVVLGEYCCDMLSVETSRDCEVPLLLTPLQR